MYYLCELKVMYSIIPRTLCTFRANGTPTTSSHALFLLGVFMLDHVSLATERAAARLDFAKNDRMILLRSHYFSALAPARHGLRAAISLLLYFLLELNGASSLCSSLAGTDYDQLLNCRCDVNNIVCIGVPVLPVLSRVYPEITVL